eukprot:TRINITY_DN38106_c0_g1_i1.p1 TRINITY_DN38106_c0_g1~~TRINITY_DN38106_c0_g1_i1.p1  ORF type:complete len:523 (-),score=150.39 TRINITY_DN38106_c0_g1_i1:27-1595(-)
MASAGAAHHDDAKIYEAKAHSMVSRMAGAKADLSKYRELIKNDPAPVYSKVAAQPVDVTEAGRFVGEYFIEPAKALKVMDQCDVLVVGAGPAGLSAAIGAARVSGTDVMLLERFGCFGGVITTVGMETLAWYRYEGTTDVEGIGIEMEKLAAKMGGTVKFPYNDSECLDADFFKTVADHLVRESGVRPLLHTYVVDVVKDSDNVVCGVVIESKSGRAVIKAKVVVDCSGDADVAHFAGAPYTMLANQERMGVTTVLNVSGVNKQKFLEYVESHPAYYSDWSREWQQYTTGKEDHLRTPYLDTEFLRAAEKGIIPADNEKFASICGSWSALTDAGEATNLNLVHLKGCDATNVRDLTRAEMEGRRQGLIALMALKSELPGFEKAKLRNFGMTLGVRDTRKIVGRHNLTAEEVQSCARFDDTVGIFPEFIDGYNVLILPTTGRYFQVPYGCLVPQRVDNLLVGGRCVAGDRISHAAMRNMMACTVTGQGAGVAAAIAVLSKCKTSEVDIKLVQEELVRQGVRIE